MADIPCTEEEQTIDALLAQIDDAVYQLPAATMALMQCLADNYPGGMLALQSEQKSEQRVRFENQCKSICESLSHCVSRHRALLIDMRIERDHQKEKK